MPHRPACNVTFRLANPEPSTNSNPEPSHWHVCDPPRTANEWLLFAQTQGRAGPLVKPGPYGACGLLVSLHVSPFIFPSTRQVSSAWKATQATAGTSPHRDGVEHSAVATSARPRTARRSATLSSL